MLSAVNCPLTLIWKINWALFVGSVSHSPSVLYAAEAPRDRCNHERFNRYSEASCCPNPVFDLGALPTLPPCCTTKLKLFCRSVPKEKIVCAPPPAACTTSTLGTLAVTSTAPTVV